MHEMKRDWDPNDDQIKQKDKDELKVKITWDRNMEGMRDTNKTKDGNCDKMKYRRT